MIPADLAVEIKNLIGSAKVDPALQRLEDWVNEHGSHKQQDIFKLLRSDYQTLQQQYIRGTMSNEEYQRALAKINGQVFEFLNVLSQKDLEPIGLGDKGRLMHNIPGKMILNEMSECIIRIAKDDEQLLRDFVLTGDSKVESIAISKKMEVELADPTGGKAFDISTISTNRQFITQNDFTQWIFDVIPLMEGSHRLAVKAIIIEEIDGKEERRDIVYRSMVTVVTSRLDATVSELMPSWKPTNILTANEEKKSKVPFAVLTKPITTLVLALVTLAALAIGGYWLRKWVGRSSSDKLLDITIMADQSLRRPITLYLDGTVAKGWSFNADSTQIVLPALRPGGHFVAVQGSNGSCKDSIFLSPQQTVFSLPCSIVPDSFTLSILTPFPDLQFFVNSKQVKTPRPETRTEPRIYRTQLRMEAGRYTLKVQDRQDRLRCEPKTITLDRNQEVSFQCEESRYSVRVELPDWITELMVLTGDLPSNLKLLTDGSSPGIPAQTSNGKTFFTVPGLKAGMHTFDIPNLNTAETSSGKQKVKEIKWNCAPLQQNITTNNQRVVFPCPRPTCNVTVTIPNGVNTFSQNQVSSLRIMVDGTLQTAQPTLTPNNRSITFRLTGIPIGKHSFKLAGYKADEYQCDPVETVLLKDRAVNISCLIIVHD
jgi:Effector-associated domain 11